MQWHVTQTRASNSTCNIDIHLRDKLDLFKIKTPYYTDADGRHWPAFTVEISGNWDGSWALGACPSQALWTGSRDPNQHSCNTMHCSSLRVWNSVRAPRTIAMYFFLNYLVSFLSNDLGLLEGKSLAGLHCIFQSTTSTYIVNDTWAPCDIRNEKTVLQEPMAHRAPPGHRAVGSRDSVHNLLGV